MTPDQYRREGAEAMHRRILFNIEDDLCEDPIGTIRAIDPAEVLAKVGAVDTGEWNAVKTVHMTYRNYRGEVSQREIVPARLWFGTTEWHPEPGWLLAAHDLGKGVERDFALVDCEFAALTVTPQPAPDAVAGRPCTDCGQPHDDDGDLCPTCVCVRAEIAAMEKNRD